MNKNIYKKRRISYSIIMILLMLLIAELTQEKEIIFPEIAALVIGAWSVNLQPWNVSRSRLILLMTLSAFFGIILVRYATIPVYFQVLAAFCFTGVSLIISATSLVPMISACILPILLGTTSFIYPISVSIMTIMIALIQALLEKNQHKEHRPYIEERTDQKEQFLTWVIRLLVIAILSYLPIYTHQYYFIAPPVIVTFVEFSFVESKARKYPYKIITLICSAALFGFLARILIDQMLGLPLTLAGTLAIICLYALFEKMQTYFPPAGAIALLPMILKVDGLWLYPIEVTLGSIILISSALLIFRPASKEETILDH
ncbi:putative membrane protein [Lachnospiraceae bacterium KM106-2]|nr:putative membrane protein [Lachnospiraceae bacterium KM106-2]